MRSLNVTFEDKDYAKLEKEKDNLGWREFILTLLKKEKKEGEKIVKSFSPFR